MEGRRHVPRPALRTLVPYTLGILIAGFLPIPIFWIWLIALICLIGGVGFSYLWKTDARRAKIGWVLLLGSICACGMFRLKVVLTSPIPPDLYDQQVHFSGEMTYQPERGKRWEAGYANGTIRPVENPGLAVEAKLLIRFREPIPLRYGDRIAVEGVLRRPNAQRNPGGFDYRSYLARRGVFGILQLDRGQEIVPTDRSSFPLLRWTESLRRRVEDVIDTAYHQNRGHAQVLKGMLLGLRSELSPDILDAFRNSGSIHILAVSGLHVGLIATVCFFGFSLLRLPRKATNLLTIAAVILYACLVGFRPSVFRASLMAVIYLISRIIERDRDLFNLLAFAALVLLLINPAQLWDIGFQLSFAAVAAIVYLAPKWEGFIARIVGLGRIDPTVDSDAAMRPRSVWGRAAWWFAMGVWGDVIRTDGYDFDHRMALLSGLSDGTRGGTVYCWARRTSGQYYVGLGSARPDLASPCDTVCLCQPLYSLDLSGADRVFWSAVDGVENTAAKFRLHRSLHRGLFRGCALGVGMDAPKKGYGDWVSRPVYLDLGRRLA